MRAGVLKDSRAVRAKREVRGEGGKLSGHEVILDLGVLGWTASGAVSLNRNTASTW
jgi:hypothetical protein